MCESLKVRFGLWVGLSPAGGDIDITSVWILKENIVSSKHTLEAYLHE